jgi:hypothetical protein
MVHEALANLDREVHPGLEGPLARRHRPPLRRAALCFLAGLALVGLLGLLPLGPGDGQAQVAPTGPASSAAQQLFRGWGKPAVAIVLSGEMRGYLQPCGCSRPQLGGLARRFNFLQSLRAKGWPVVAADLGDLPQRSGPQKMLKYITTMKALDLLDYAAVGIGQGEIAMPLLEALANYALNNPSPRVVAANLQDRGANQLYNGMVEAFELAGKHKGTAPRVAISGLISDEVVARAKDPNVKVDKTLRQTLGQLRAQKPDLVVLLYQGSLKEAKECARFCVRCRKDNPALPAVDVILCLSDEDEPPGVPDREGRTLIVRIGHKGRYVGVVGAFRTGQPQLPFELRYQLVPIVEELETPKGKEKDNPVIALMEEYAKEVQRGNFLARYPRSVHPVQLAFPNAEYVGSLQCNNGCHKEANKIWQNSAHAHAYQKLVTSTRPSLRQFDGECVLCHVVGFAYKTGFTDEKTTGHLKDVGCESCHGPGSEHVAKPRNMKVRELMNPWKVPPGPLAQHQHELLVDKFCQTCHDIDNDVHWNFAKNWPKIIHMERQRAGAAPAPLAPQIREQRQTLEPGPALEPPKRQ